MILYLDASAEVKRYVTEQGSAERHQAIASAIVVGMVIIGRVEIVAAFAKAVRMRALSASEAERARQAFYADWPDYLRLRITESLASRADDLAWHHGLRAYDAVQLAAALLWQEGLEASVTLATFDRQLWQAGRHSGLCHYEMTIMCATS